MEKRLVESYKNVVKEKGIEKKIVCKRGELLGEKISYPSSEEKIKGKYKSIIIKGYGKRGKYTRSLLALRIGLRERKRKSEISSSHELEKKEKIPKKIIPGGLIIRGKRSTWFMLYSGREEKMRSFMEKIIRLQGSSRKLPGYAYKDIGIRRYGKGVKKKVRRV